MLNEVVKEAQQQVVLRDAIPEDRPKVQKVLEECFGSYFMIGQGLDVVGKHYKVIEVGNRVVAFSGILPPTQTTFDGYEISWTGCLQEYRKHGYITKIIKACLEEIPNDGMPVYCSCWRVKDNSYINLHGVMQGLGFKEIERATNPLRITDNNYQCIGCVNNCADCYCYNDLYILRR